QSIRMSNHWRRHSPAANSRSAFARLSRSAPSRRSSVVTSTALGPSSEEASLLHRIDNAAGLLLGEVLGVELHEEHRRTSLAVEGPDTLPDFPLAAPNLAEAEFEFRGAAVDLFLDRLGILQVH